MVFLQFHVYTPGVNKKPYSALARIKQLQLEQDSGKTLHEDDQSLVDLNRAGAPLMELVFEPDLKDGEEAASLIKELIMILQRIGACTCKMEEGALRVDANVSINRKGQPLGTRTEIKNIGSVRGVAGAIKYEIERQIQVVESGGTVANETRAWDANSKTTLSMRDKEQQQDYRYMPEPNLPPLHIAIDPVEQGCVSVEEIKKKIPELPEQTRARLIDTFGLSNEQAVILVNEVVLLSLFEKSLLQKKLNTKLLANVLINDLLTFTNKEKIILEEIHINPESFCELIELIQDEVISRSTARLILERMVHGDQERPNSIVLKEGWAQINNKDEIKKLCDVIIQENQKMVKQYKDGKTKVFKALLGQIAVKSKNKANMALASEILKTMLDR